MVRGGLSILFAEKFAGGLVFSVRRVYNMERTEKEIFEHGRRMHP